MPPVYIKKSSCLCFFYHQFSCLCLCLISSSVSFLCLMFTSNGFPCLFYHQVACLCYSMSPHVHVFVQVVCLCEAGWEGENCLCQSPHVHVFVQVVVSVRQAGKEKTVSVCVSTCPRLFAGGCLCETGWEGENYVSLCLHMSTSLCRWLSL